MSGPDRRHVHVPAPGPRDQQRGRPRRGAERWRPDSTGRVLAGVAACLVAGAIIFAIAKAAGVGDDSSTTTPSTTSAPVPERADDVARAVADDLASPAYDAPDLAAAIRGARRQSDVLVFETTLAAGDRDAVGICVLGQEHSERVEVHGAEDETLASTHLKHSASDGSPFYFCDLY